MRCRDLPGTLFASFRNFKQLPVSFVFRRIAAFRKNGAGSFYQAAKPILQPSCQTRIRATVQWARLAGQEQDIPELSCRIVTCIFRSVLNMFWFWASPAAFMKIKAATNYMRNNPQMM